MTGSIAPTIVRGRVAQTSAHLFAAVPPTVSGLWAACPPRAVFPGKPRGRARATNRSAYKLRRRPPLEGMEDSNASDRRKHSFLRSGLLSARRRPIL